MSTWTKTEADPTPPAPWGGCWYRKGRAIGTVLANPATGAPAYHSGVATFLSDTLATTGRVIVMVDHWGDNSFEVQHFAWADAEAVGPTRESVGEPERGPITFTAAEIGRAMDEANRPVVG